MASEDVVGWLLDSDPALRWQVERDLAHAPEDLWRGTESLREGSGDQVMEQMRRMTLPPEALLLRRMEGLLFQIACTVRAEARWGPLLRELVEAGPPVGALGAEHAEWLASRSR